MKNEIFMEKALEHARKALSLGEFPVGCVIVHADTVIAHGARKSTQNGSVNEIDHAEMVALRKLDQGRPAVPRENLILYCTLEPCLMCFAAILLSGIRQIVYAYEDVMGGGTGCDLTRMPILYRDAGVVVTRHVLRDQSLELFKAFFSNPANRYWKDSPLATYTLSQ